MQKIWKLIKIICLSVFSTFTLAHPHIRYLFSHGIADTFKQAYPYAKTYKRGNKIHYNERYIIDNPITFNFPDAFLRHLPNIKQANLAQDNDIAYLKLKIEKTMQNNPKKELVTFGVSRGASTILNLMALNDLPMVKALVLESPFDAMVTVLNNKREQLPLGWLLSPDFGQLILEICFWQYKRDGIRPIDLVSGIRKDLPILIICSLEDRLVPWYSSVKLYQKLKQSGHPSAHLLVVDHGQHAKIWTGPDGDKYQAAVHAFYAKYNLPSDPILALEGKKYLC